MPTSEFIPWHKGDWKGYYTEYPGTPIGLFNLTIRNRARIMTLTKLSPDQLETLDPEVRWQEWKNSHVKNTRLVRGDP